MVYYIHSKDSEKLSEAGPLIAAGRPSSFAAGQKNHAETDTGETTNT
jgi:hypothetical protein